MNANIRAVQKRQKHIAHRLKSIAHDARRCEALLCRLEDTWLRLEEAPHPAMPPLSGAGSCSDDSRPEVQYFANLRCGEWYLPRCSQFRRGTTENSEDKCNDAASLGSSRSTHGLPCVSPLDAVSDRAFEHQPTSCYFKSSDGHYGQWSFSTSRLNAHVIRDCLIPRFAREQRLANVGRVKVIVDATQHGKKYPDALSKTIPIWAMVMNAAYAPSTAAGTHCPHLGPADALNHGNGGDAGSACLLPPWLDPSETSAILDKLPRFVKSFEDLEASRHRSEWCLSLPITVTWLHAADPPHMQQATLDEVVRMSSRFHVLVLLCASGDAEWQRYLADTPTAVTDEPPDTMTRSGWVYVPGAGDDHQSWGRGLTPRTFWLHEASLNNPLLSLDAVEEAVDSVVKGKHVLLLPRNTTQVTWSQLWEASERKQIVLRRSAANQPLLPAWDVRCIVTSRATETSELVSTTIRQEDVAISTSKLTNREWCVLVLVKESAVRTLIRPSMLHLDTHTQITLEVNSKTTKHGIQRAISWLLDALGFHLSTSTATQHNSNDDGSAAKSIFSHSTGIVDRHILLASSDSDIQLVAALCIALRVAVLHLPQISNIVTTMPSVTLTKARIRAHQTLVVELLGPESVTRSSMIQLNRVFLPR